MDKEFIPYDEALTLKELGFDGPCFGYYKNNVFKFASTLNDNQTFRLIVFNVSSDLNDKDCVAPLYQQAFRWFRKNYNLESDVSAFVEDFKVRCYLFEIMDVLDDTCYDSDEFKSHELAELGCLRKLIEIVKEKKL